MPDARRVFCHCLTPTLLFDLHCYSLDDRQFPVPSGRFSLCSDGTTCSCLTRTQKIHRDILLPVGFIVSVPFRQNVVVRRRVSLHSPLHDIEAGVTFGALSWHGQAARRFYCDNPLAGTAFDPCPEYRTNTTTLDKATFRAVFGCVVTSYCTPQRCRPGDFAQITAILLSATRSGVARGRRTRPLILVAIAGWIDTTTGQIIRLHSDLNWSNIQGTLVCHLGKRPHGLATTQ